MREETTTRTLYMFSELSPKAQDAALDNLRDTNIDFDWWESVYEDAARVGLKITGFDVGRGQSCEGVFISSALECAHEIEKEHGDQCETFKTAARYLARMPASPKDDTDDSTEEWDEYREAMEGWGAEFLVDLLEDYRVMLSKEYDYQTSDEGVRESIEANGWEFTEDGKLA